MTLFRSISAFGLLIAFAAGTSAAPGMKANAKKKHHSEVVHGTVVAVHHKDAHHGTITIARHHHHHKGNKPLSGTKAAAGRKPANGQQQAAANKLAGGQKGQANAANKGAAGQKPGAQANAGNPMQGGQQHHHHHKTFKVDSKTKFEHELKTPNGTMHARASFPEVRKGEHVAIHAHGHTAKKVEIKHHKKKRPMGSGRPTRKKIK